MKKGLEWGKARSQLWTIQPELEKLLQGGCTKRKAFEDFSKAGRISMSYSRFCEMTARSRYWKPKAPETAKKENFKEKGNTAAVPVAQPSASAQVPVSQSTVEAPATPPKSQEDKKGPIIIGGEKNPGFADLVITDDQIF